MPRVVLDDSVAPDFRTLIQATWVQFLNVFDARASCFGDIRIVAVKELADRAQYDPTTVTMLVRVPERGSLLRAALVHEWAHHVEFQCAAHSEMRLAFLDAQGMPRNTPWQSMQGSTHLPFYEWGKIPSEQYAETVVAVVLGDRSFWTPVRITDEGLRVVRAWAKKEPLP